MSPFEGVAVVIALAACATDIRARRIPNTLTGPAMVAGILAHAMLRDGHGALAAVAGCAVGLALFFPIFALGGMGGGDVKLMGALGAWLGVPSIVWTGLYGAVAGGILALGVAASRGYLRQAFSNIGGLLIHWSLVGVRPVPALTLEHGHGPRLPYALPILAGLVTALWQR